MYVECLHDEFLSSWKIETQTWNQASRFRLVNTRSGNEGGKASNTLLNPFQFFTSLVIKGLIIIHDCYLLAITDRHGWILRPFSLPLVRDTWYPTVITQNDLKWRGGGFVYEPRVRDKLAAFIVYPSPSLFLSLYSSSLLLVHVYY